MINYIFCIADKPFYGLPEHSVGVISGRVYDNHNIFGIYYTFWSYYLIWGIYSTDSNAGIGNLMMSPALLVKVSLGSNGFPYFKFPVNNVPFTSWGEPSMELYSVLEVFKEASNGKYSAKHPPS